MLFPVNPFTSDMNSAVAPEKGVDGPRRSPIFRPYCKLFLHCRFAELPKIFEPIFRVNYILKLSNQIRFTVIWSILVGVRSRRRSRFIAPVGGKVGQFEADSKSHR